jgi:hypothetical protein
MTFFVRRKAHGSSPYAIAIKGASHSVDESHLQEVAAVIEDAALPRMIKNKIAVEG